jgi:hypothetical protein
VQVSAAGVLDSTGGTIQANGSAGGAGRPVTCPGTPNAGGGAGGGSGGSVILEGTMVTVGTVLVTGGAGGVGGAGLLNPGAIGGLGGPLNMPGGNGKNSSGAHNVSVNNCSLTENPGAGGGGGAGGYVTINQATSTMCLCRTDADCSTGRCVDVANQCNDDCTGLTAPARHDAFGCQLVESTPASFSDL